MHNVTNANQTAAFPDSEVLCMKQTIFLNKHQNRLI